jgi:hypothetical protein
MPTADEYLKYADECMAWARQADTEAKRKPFLDMARSWRQAAAKMKGGIVPVDLPLPDDSDTGAPQ